MLGVDEVLDRLRTSIAGLEAAESTTRLTVHGRNELVEADAPGPLRLLREQLTAVMVLMLVGAAALSLALAKFFEAGAIAAIVVLFAMAVGLSVAATGLLILATVTEHSGYPRVLVGLVVMASGIALGIMPGTDSIMGSFPKEKAGTARRSTTRVGKWVNASRSTTVAVRAASARSCRRRGAARRQFTAGV